jgi:hypothetical protein
LHGPKSLGVEGQGIGVARRAADRPYARHDGDLRVSGLLLDSLLLLAGQGGLLLLLNLLGPFLISRCLPLLHLLPIFIRLTSGLVCLLLSFGLCPDLLVQLLLSALLIVPLLLLTALLFLLLLAE